MALTKTRSRMKADQFDTVAALLAETEGYARFAVSDIIEAGGFRYEVAASGASDHHVTTAGGVKLYVLPWCGGMNVLAWGARRAEDDPSFDNSDVFDAITNYIESNLGDGTERNLLFPPGLYKHSRTFKIRRSRVALTGLGNLSGSISFTPQKASGAHLCYTANDGGVGVDIGNDPGVGFIYHTKITNMRFGGISAGTQNQNAMRMRGISEFYFSNVSWSTANILLDVVGASIGSIDTFYMAESKQAHIRFGDETGYSPFLSANAFFMQNGNFWLAEEAMLLFEGQFTTQIVLSKSWMERSKSFIRLRGGDYTSTVEGLRFDSVQFFQDSIFGGSARNGWLVDAEASQTFTSRQLRVSALTFDKCVIGSSTTITGSAIQYTKGVNASGGSYLEQMLLQDCLFTGTSAYTVVNSDTANSTANIVGSRVFGSKAWFGGSVRIQRLSYEFGRWVFNGNAITLPQTAPNSFAASDGQFWWSTSSNSLRVTKSGVAEHVALRAASQSDSVATDVTGLRADFNALLAKLRTSGGIAP